MNNILTVPNLLTFLRMALVPVFASLLFYGYFGWALFVFFFAGVSDGVDGFVARRFNQQSELGTILDPIADKLLMTTAFVILTLPNILPADNKHFPVAFWVSAAVIGRDVLIVTVALAIFIMTDFRGFKPSNLGKASTVVQICAIGIILFAAVFPAFSGYYLPTIYFTVTFFAVASGFHYIFHVAKLMNQKKENEI
ncbi:MAG: CDP-alcohol phosphatidyltransferase family protein [Pyrinomonadaceae bacterium]|nr:CDP-alcohol phosphatidyltransferase family protein [Pyrinomonadaceae bacterium]